jgi:hypothetical protein
VIAPGLWAAIDANTCQNRQNSAVVDATEDFGRFGGFVTSESPDDQRSADDHTPDSGMGPAPMVVPAV